MTKNIETYHPDVLKELCSKFLVPLREDELKRKELRDKIEESHFYRLSKAFKTQLREGKHHQVTLSHYNGTGFTTDGIAEKFCDMLSFQGWVVSHNFDNVGEDASNYHSITVFICSEKDKGITNE